MRQYLIGTFAAVAAAVITGAPAPDAGAAELKVATVSMEPVRQLPPDPDV